MYSPCEKMQDNLADFVLGVLSPKQTDAVNEHLGRCGSCSRYVESLKRQSRLLTQFSEKLNQDMEARENRAIETVQSHTQAPGVAPVSLWSTITKSRMTKLAAAATVVLVASLLLNLLDKSATPAYAVDETIAAMKEIKTVYMAGEFYKQGEFECWMKFDGDPDKPTHIWLGRAGHNMCKICSPAGVFGLNRRTKAVHFASRDERGKAWVIKFGSFFRNAVKKAGRSNSVEINYETDRQTEEELIVVHIMTPKREQKFWVDPESKLPIRFTTIREDAPMEMMRRTLALKNVTQIRYNEEPPEGIFDMPADAKIVEEEVDCMVDPDSGLVADGMTREEACLAIVEQTGQALIDVDRSTLTKLDLFFRLYTPEIWEKVKDMKAAGQWVDKFTVIGDPYQEGELWYVPCEIKAASGTSEVQNAMIKFYQMEGKTLCFIIGSKEKGVVD